MITIGTQIENQTNGIGIVVEINGSKAIVDFNGTKKELLTAFLKEVKVAKAKKYMTAKAVELPSFNEVVNRISGDAQMRGSLFVTSELFTSIEKLADAQNHFAGSIIADARNGKFVSEKQACVVAFFAQKNNLIK